MKIFGIDFNFWGRKPDPFIFKPKKPFNGLIKPKNEKIAICLPGGASYGRGQMAGLYWLWQIGLLQMADIITGTSVGGLNAFIASKYLSELKFGMELWEDIKENKDVYDGEIKGGLGGVMGLVGQVFKDNGQKSVLNPKGLYKIIEREFGAYKMGDLYPHVIIAATDITTRERVTFDSKKNKNIPVALVAKATSAIPGIFPAVEWDKNGKKHYLVDGGIGRNNPVELAIEAGATKIILIGTYSDEKKINILDGKLWGVASASIDTSMQIWENEAWEEFDEYNLKAKQNPAKYPTIELLDCYPAKGKDYSTGPLDFNYVRGAQVGYDRAVKVFNRRAVEAFLK